ncbi:DinB family protein [uncultured Jatrophihabitans sp.]|uniref:DinB family protein n=1 Tax=uncultured Jatrophihabitans sp. TaxID=1610747 RepID=UPI0035CAFE8E
MTQFFRRDLSGARFEEVDFTSTWFRNVYFVGATLRGAWLEDVDIDGELRNVRINGVDVGPLIEAELDRRSPERAKLRPTDADGFREAWAVIEQAWPSTLDRARRLPPELLHERVGDEWSFIETLRHLLFASDAWLLRAFLGRPDPYTPLDLPHTEHEPDPAVPNDPDARPSLAEVLELRAERTALMRDAVADLTDDVLAGDTAPVLGPGYPSAGVYPVARCLKAVLNEEWLHRLYAERDLAVLEARHAETAT